jgi:hypothetical protein
MFMTYLGNKFRMPSFNGSLAIATKPNAHADVCTVMLLYTTPHLEK